MMQDARNGLLSRIIVKKYDRFSQNMREYLNIIDELDKYGVTVYSLSEPFNTATKEGRMMRNNRLNFAEFERETMPQELPMLFRQKQEKPAFIMAVKSSLGTYPKDAPSTEKQALCLFPRRMPKL